MSDQVILALTSCPDGVCADGVRSTCFWDTRLQDQAGILLIMSGNERYLDWVRMGVQRKGE